MIIFWCFIGITLIGNIFTQSPTDDEISGRIASLKLPNYDNTETLKTNNYRIETDTDKIKITCQLHTDLSDSYYSLLEEKEILEIHYCNIQKNTNLKMLSKTLFSVKLLEISQSDVVVLSKDINLMQLDSLYIGDCIKVKINSDLFVSQDDLTVLTIENIDVLKYEEARIVEESIIPPTVSRSNKIKKLNLRAIRKITENFLRDFKNLVSLRYNQNSFKSLETDPFKRLTQLRDLNLNNNFQMELTTDLFTGLDYLQDLYISQNNLISLGDKVFKNLKTLYKLYLSYNEITEITSDTFKGLDQLQLLDLDHNNLTLLANEPFKTLIKLQKLCLGYNKITEIASNNFKGLRTLTGLSLNNNRLTAIENGTFEELSGLTFLSLENNQITTIAPGSFNGLEQLQKLYLNDNDLILFEYKVFKGFREIKELKIYNNKFKEPTTKWFFGLNNKACIYFDEPEKCVQYSVIRKKGFLPKALKRIAKRRWHK